MARFQARDHGCPVSPVQAMKSSTSALAQPGPSRACVFVGDELKRQSCTKGVRGSQRPYCMLCVHCPKCVDNPHAVTCELCAACRMCAMFRNGK